MARTKAWSMALGSQGVGAEHLVGLSFRVKGNTTKCLWFIMVYHGLSWYIMVYHGLSWFTNEIHWSSLFHIFSLIQTYAYEHIYKCIKMYSFYCKGVKCVNYIHIHTRYMLLTQLNHCFDGQCAPCPLSWPGSRPYQGGGSVWDSFEGISCDKYQTKIVPKIHWHTIEVDCDYSL